MKKALMAGVLAFCGSAWADDSIQIPGTVVQVGAGVAKVRIESDYLPKAGDRVEFSMIIPGVEERAKAGSGTVIAANKKFVLVRLRPQGPAVARDYQAVVYAENPRQPASRGGAARPSSVGSGGGTAFLPSDEPAAPTGSGGSGTALPAFSGQGGTTFIPRDEPAGLASGDTETPRRITSAGLRRADITPNEPDGPVSGNNRGTPRRVASGGMPARRPGNPLAAVASSEPTLIFKGHVLDGAKTISSLTLHVGATSHSFLGGEVRAGNFQQWTISAVELAANGEIVIPGLPISASGENGAAGERKSVRATLHFDPRGKPRGGVRRLFGTVKTAGGDTYTFDARPFKLTPLPDEGRPPEPAMPNGNAGSSQIVDPDD